MQEGKTVGEWREAYKARCSRRKVQESVYAGYVYDAVWTYALALHELTTKNPMAIAQMHSLNTTRFYNIYLFVLKQ